MCSVYLRTKYLRTCVNLVDVDQNPRPDFVSIKGCFVFTESGKKSINHTCIQDWSFVRDQIHGPFIVVIYTVLALVASN